jgi:hypothetical protein
LLLLTVSSGITRETWRRAITVKVLQVSYDDPHAPHANVDLNYKFIWLCQPVPFLSFAAVKSLQATSKTILL